MTVKLLKHPNPQYWSDVIVQNAPAGIITVDGQMLITEINPAAEKLMGYSRDAALGQPYIEILYGGQSGKEGPLEMALSARKVLTKEDVLQNHFGEPILVLLTAFASKDDQGMPIGGFLIFRDLGPFKRLEEERRQLVSMFAHDLKTPVVAALGLLNRLRQGKVEALTPHQTEYINTIYQDIQRLEKLINNFLDFSRIDLHVITPQTSAIQVEIECQDVLALLRPLAEAKGIEFKIEFPEKNIVLHVDPLLFRRALENLIGNAVKYSPPHSWVVLEVREAGVEIQFAVKDQGPGISPQDVAHLFEVYYRGMGSGRETGFGLGLATVKRIIESHGGRVWVETAIGQGTTFFFTLPIGVRANRSF